MGEIPVQITFYMPATLATDLCPYSVTELTWRAFLCLIYVFSSLAVWRRCKEPIPSNSTKISINHINVADSGIENLF